MLFLNGRGVPKWVEPDNEVCVINFFHRMMHRRFRERVVASSSEEDTVSRDQTAHRQYHLWDDSCMVKAMRAVEEGVSIRRASEMYNVPKSSLYDRVSGKVQHGCRPGPSSYLSIEEEDELVHFLIRCSQIGYPHTLSQVLALVQQIVDYKQLDKTVTYGWWQRFCQRHSEVSLRTAVPLSMARAMASDYDSLNRYFDMLEDTLKKNRIFNDPTRIFNCDEVGVPLSPKGTKVVAPRGVKDVSGISGATKAQITVLACSCASGSSIPPMVIFGRKTLNPQLSMGEIPGTLYGLSKKGWITRDLFLEWFKKHFLACVPSVRPLLLVMDGHSSHYGPDVIRMAAEEKVILFALPPNTTHLTQPLDKGCFSPLKSCWRQVCHEFYSKYPGRIVTQYDFSSLFSESWKRAMTPQNVISSFSVTGIYPFNRSKVLDKIPRSPTHSSFEPESLQKRTGLAYIPLFSPARPFIQPLNSSTRTSPNGTALERSRSESDVFNITGQRSTLGKFLKMPKQPSKLPTKRPKSSGKVLTSLQNMRDIEEKELQKKLEEREKQQRKELREMARSTRTCQKKMQATKATKSKLMSTEMVGCGYGRVTVPGLLFISLSSIGDFSEQEIALFTRRWENGYDLTIDERYNTWLSMNHPDKSK